MTIRDAVAIFRGYKRRRYEDYRVAAWEVYQMARLWIKDAQQLHPDRTMPPYDELDLTAAERRKLDFERKIKGM